MSSGRLVHHELCFGCGRINLFGLVMDVEPAGERKVRGRGFVKQDHQGADRGLAHEGVILAALSDAMGLACGEDMRATRLQLDLHQPVPVGCFLDLEAEAGQERRDGMDAEATARIDGELVAAARGSFARRLGV